MNNQSICLLSIIILLIQVSCQENKNRDDSFNDKISLLESNPKLYLSKPDSIQITDPKNEKEATHLLLVSLANNYVNSYYPPKVLLQKIIYIFSENKQVQKQLESLLFLARIYKQEDNLNQEVQTIKEAIRIASEIEDKEWLCCLYSYLGNMYIRKYNMLKFIKYQTLANQYVKDISFQDMDISTQVQMAKSFLYIGNYKKSYELLILIENSISKNSIYYNEMKCLQGITLFKTKQWKLCIEKLQEAIILNQTDDFLFVCHSVLTYCYYYTNDLVNANKHRKLAIKYDTDSETNFAEIEFYRLCAEFARNNNNTDNQLDCLYKAIERYEILLKNLNGKSLDGAIQAYAHFCDKNNYEKKISIYRYAALIFLFIASIGLLIHINKKRKKAYQIVVLQQQIQALEGLKSIKNEAKAFILRDFEVAKQIAMLRYTQKEQCSKLLKDLEKFSFIKNNDLLTTQWDNFYKHIDLSFDNFYSMIKEQYSSLNEKEIQLCCMMIAGFKTEEIAAIWMQSIFSVHKYKTNIRKKIKAPDGANIIKFILQKK